VQARSCIGISAEPRHRARPARSAPLWRGFALTLLALVLLIAPAPGAHGIPGQVPPMDASGCAQTVTGSSAAGVEEALSRARPGDVVCVGPGDYGSGPIEVRRSGKPDAPIELRAQGPVVVGGLRVRANHVRVTGFEVTAATSSGPSGPGSAGISLRGKGLAAVGNLVHDTSGGGISCEDAPPSCVGAVIALNTIRRADGTGIVVYGRNTRVEMNDVAESVRVRSSDADGIRFFGSGHVIRANRIHDILDDGYFRDAPHTDCFQTFDNDRPPTVGVVIDANICDNVDHQCLIAQARQSGKSRSLRFTNNICRNRGSQALLVEGFRGVQVAFNIFAETIQYRATFFWESSHGTFVNNILDGPYRAYELDQSSRPGWRAQRNLQAKEPGTGRTQAGVEKVEILGAGLDVPLEMRYRPVPGSPVIDAGMVVPGVEHDASGTPRPLDGGSGSAHVDVGPYEYRSVTGPEPL
jgi:Right handed beta helix region